MLFEPGGFLLRNLHQVGTQRRTLAKQFLKLGPSLQ